MPRRRETLASALLDLMGNRYGNRMQEKLCQGDPEYFQASRSKQKLVGWSYWGTLVPVDLIDKADLLHSKRLWGVGGLLDHPYSSDGILVCSG